MSRTRSPSIRAVPCVSMLVLLSACHTWSEVETDLAADERLPSPARVELVNGEKLEVRAARVVGDSLIAFHLEIEEALPDGSSRPIRIGVPLDDVARIERKKPNTALTAAGVAVGLAAIFYGVAILAFASSF